jgi:membrane-bound serine protease (ClpP class)
MLSRIRIAAGVFFLLYAFASSSQGAIARIDLDGNVDPITSEFIVRSIAKAEAERVSLLLIRINTPGGLGSSMEEIIGRMLNSQVPIIAYVTPSGAKAASAGFFILLAADVAAMAPGTSTGAAHPLMAIGGIPVEGGDAGKTLTEKVTSHMSAYLRSIAAKRNRNLAEAEKGVRESKSFTDAEALQDHLIDLIARDEADLMKQLQGYKVRLFSGREVVLNPQGEAAQDYTMTARQKFLRTIAQPSLALLLGLVGLILLYFEFTHPGFIAPGVIGGICLLVSILGFSFLPINYVGVLLILLALGLFIAEVKVQAFGALGIGGVAAMVIGLVILVDAPDAVMRIGLSTAIATAIPFAALFIFLLFAVLRSLRQRVTTGAAGMIGLIGVTDSEVHTTGRVKVRGEYWNASSVAPIPVGKRIKVLGVDELKLNVEEMKE